MRAVDSKSEHPWFFFVSAFGMLLFSLYPQAKFHVKDLGLSHVSLHSTGQKCMKVVFIIFIINALIILKKWGISCEAMILTISIIEPGFRHECICKLILS